MSKTPWLKRVLGDPDADARLETAVSELGKRGRKLEAIEANLEDVCKQLDRCEVELQEAAQREESLASAIVSAEARATKAETAHQAVRNKVKELQQERSRERQEANRLGSLHKARFAKLEQDKAERKAHQETIRSRADVLLQEGRSLKTKLSASEQKAHQAQQLLEKLTVEQSQGQKRHDEELQNATGRSTTLSSLLAVNEETVRTMRQCVLSLIRVAATSSSQLLGTRAHLAVELAVQGGVQCLTASPNDSDSSEPAENLSGPERVTAHFHQLGIAREVALESGNLRITFFENLEFSPNVARWIAAYALECINEANGLLLRIDSVEASEGGLSARCSPRLPPQ